MGRAIVFVDRKHPLRGRGGDVTYLRAHARAALRLGFEPHVFCAGPRSRTQDSEVGAIHEVAAGPGPAEHLTLPLHAPGLAAAIARFAEGEAQGGTLLLHGFGAWACASVAAAHRLAGRRRVLPLASAYTIRSHETAAKLAGLGPHHRRRDRLRLRFDHAFARAVLPRFERRAYAGSRRVLVNYDSVRRLLLSRWDLGDRIRLIPYASELAFRAAPGGAGPAARGVPLVVAVSRQDARKGVDVLLHALARLRGRAAFRACLVGGGPLLEPHRRLAARLGLSRQVELLGWVDDPAVLLAQADLFVLPSLEEASGSLSLLEALQLGLPCVASRVDGIPEDVCDGENALLVAPGDAGALAAALARALADAGLRRRLGAAASDTFSRRFGAARFSAALGAVYDELCAWDASSPA